MRGSVGEQAERALSRQWKLRRLERGLGDQSS